MDALMQRSFFVSRPTGLYRSKFKNAIHFLLGCKQSEKEERRDGSMESQYYTQTPQQVLHAMESREEGLTTQQAQERIEKNGPNALREERKKPVWQVFLEQFKDLLVVILVVAAVISMLSGNAESTIVIFAVLILNAVLGTVQHCKAEKSLESLKAMSAPTARVFRDGERLIIPSVQIVPGDIVELEAGDMVVADGRILHNYSLKVNESSLTGESEGVEKTEAVIEGDKVALGDRKNLVFSGSLVVYGRALVVVTSTGMNTELGKVAALMNQTQRRKTPLQESLDQFSRRLAMIILIICVGVFALSLYHAGGFGTQAILDSLMFAVALAVAAIPEALSSIVTIVQAMGTQKMAKENAIMKELKAVETLGAVSVICSDKTGTLTQNRMTPQTAYVDGSLVDCSALTMEEPIHRRLIQTAILASDATTDEEKGTAVGDPTEVALIMIGDGMGIEERAYREQSPRLCELAFDSDRKLMSTLHVLDGGETVMLTKGALDVLLEHSTQLLTSEGVVELTDQRREQILAVNQELSSKGLRVLAFAYRDMPGATRLDFTNEREYTFIGLISMIDPPRPEAIQAVADAKRGGIRTVMITGDHRVTASAIARQIGILQDGELALSGHELDEMDDGALDQKLEQVSVYARVSPEHKIRIVEAWKRRGKIVAMTGDGVNDAPALKSADIGVAMGVTGTEVSKDAAAMILADDNFATIVKAVVNGRGVYTNIKNAITFLLSGNMAGILSVLVTSILGLPNPFLPVHLLFINLLTDSLPAIAIGVEPSSGDMLSQKPRDPSEPILNWSLLGRIGIYGLLIAAATMAAYFLGLNSGGAPLAMTLAFATLTLARLFHGFNCRGRQSLFALGLLSNKASLAAFAAGVVFLAAVLFVPFLEGLFQVAPFTLEQIGLCAILALLPTVIIQIGKCAGLR
jgi:Ca2+-transporting ATPase